MRDRPLSPSPSKSPQQAPPPAAPAAEALPDFEIEVEDHSFRGFLVRWLTDWRVLAALAALALVVAGIVVGPGWYRSAKAWRARHFLADARQAEAAGDLPKAISAYRRATTIASYDPRVIHAVTIFRAGQGDPAAVRTLKRWVEDGDATADETLIFANAALRAGSGADAHLALDRLPATMPEPLASRRARAQIELAAAEGKTDQAIAFARDYSGKAVGEAASELQLVLAQLLLRAGNAGQAGARDEAIQLLAILSASPNRSGIEALRLLATREPDAVPGIDLPAKLRTHPLCTPDDELLAAGVELTAHPSDRERIVAALQLRRKSAPEADQLAFARWLNRRGIHAEALAAVGEGRTEKNQDWLLVYLDALAGLKRWGDVKQRVEGSAGKLLDDPVRYLFLARAALELGDPVAAEQHWREVHRYARLGKPETLLYVARYAEQMGMRSEAIKAFRRLSERKETAMNGFLGLLRCQPPETPAGELLPIYEEFLEKFPDLTEAKNDRAYLSLLCHRDIDKAAGTARQLNHQFPDVLSFLSTTALAELRLGHIAEAEALYAGRPIDWSSAPAPFKAVRVATLAAQARHDEAAELRKTIREETLRPEERALLKEKPPAHE